MEQGITKQQIITTLTRSEHGKLAEYVPTVKVAAKQEGEFLAHLIAWNQKNGAIRDAKIALPMASLAEPSFNGELAVNSYAHLAMQSPRELVRAFRFAKELRPAGHGKRIQRLIEQYLRARENDTGWFTATALQHRQALISLYTLAHVKPNSLAKNVLRLDKESKLQPRVGAFKDLNELKDMDPKRAAGVIMERRIPFLTAMGALGARAKDPDVVLALIERMTATELVTNTKMLEKLGVKTNPALRAAFEAGLKRVAESKKQVLKTTRAAQQMTDPTLKAKLQAAQEKQLQTMQVDGDWLVLGDKSASMSEAIEASRVVASTLAKMVKGSVTLVFFDAMPRVVDVTGKDYEQILDETKRVSANGSTSIGCGLQWALSNKREYDGVAIVSDGAENTAPGFADVLKKYQQLFDKEVPAYLYWMKCHGPNGSNNNPEALRINMERAGLPLDVFDLRSGVDYHSLPNVVATMRSNRFTLIDAIMATPLLTVEQALTKGG